jgi:hypothetical protein
MKNKTDRLNLEDEYRSKEYCKQLYGKHVIVTRLGDITIIHLDRPSKKEIQKRKEKIMREELNGKAFFDDCPLCEEFKKYPYNIVYY